MYSSTSPKAVGNQNNDDANQSPNLIWDMLKEIGESERHFNNLEAEYRKLASVWLLAGFAGIGYILKEDLNISIPREVAILGMGLATSVGVLLLWIIDLLVYHRLLDACFAEAMRLEKIHPEMPQIRSNMVNSQNGGGVTSRLRWFYIFLAIAPVVFSAPIFLLWCLDRYGAMTALGATFALIFLYSSISRMIWRDSFSLIKALPRSASTDETEHSSTTRQ